MADVQFRKGLIALNTVAGDAIGFTRTFPLSRRRKLKNATWWEVSVGDAAAVVAWADTKGISVDPAVREYAVTAWRSGAKHMARATATSLGFQPMPSIRGLSSTLLDTQKALVAASPDTWFHLPDTSAPGHRAMILADDQGLGKTITALAVLRVEGSEARRAVVVCPTSLTNNWLAEAAQHFEPGTFTPWIATTRNPSPPPDGTDLVVIGWDILADWADQLVAWGPDAVVSDEGHYAKSGKQQKRKSTREVRGPDGQLVRDPKTGKVLTEPVMVQAKDRQGRLRVDKDGNPVMEQEVKVLGGSQRGSAILALGKAVAKAHGIVIPMSGTPIVNRPLELLPMLEFCGVLDLFVSAEVFKNRYCGPRRKSIGGGRSTTDYSGASNLLELNTRLLTSGIYFRRTKKVLVDAGLLKRKYVDKAYIYDYAEQPRPWLIPLTDAERREYEAIKQQTQAYFGAVAEEIAATKRIGRDTQLMRQKVAAAAGSSQHLKVITELRQAVGLLKVPHIIEQTQRLIDKGERVVIAAHHRAVVDAYAEAFGDIRIQGAMGTRAIEEAKARFNGAPIEEAPVLVLSVEAGKTGHTLCKQTLEGVGPACAHMFLAEQVWTPADEAQVQDRIWRIGQDREVRISNALARGTIDESIYGQRQKKRRVFNAVIDAVDEAAMVESARVSAQAEKEGAGSIALQLLYGA